MCYSGICLQPELHKKKMVVTLGMGENPPKNQPLGGGGTNQRIDIYEVPTI